MNEKFKEGQTVWVKAEFDSYAGANQAWILIQGEAELAQLDDIREDLPWQLKKSEIH